MKRFPLGSLVLALTLGCGPAPELSDRPVAKIDGTSLSRGAFEAYLEMNLADQPENELGAAESSGDLVRSALLDSWIDERLVLIEAQAREFTIGNKQLDKLLDDPAYEPGEGDRQAQRNFLRDRLLIELVQGQVLNDVAYPSIDDATAWLAENPGASDDIRVRLRSLRFDDAETAQQVHRNLRANRLTFDEAIVQNSEDESQGAPTIVDWATFSPEVRQAIEDLRPGWSSAPVEFGGSAYLFQVVEWIEPNLQLQTENAQARLYSAARRAAWERFVAGLRGRAKVRIVTKNLPFRYVSADSE